MFYFTFITYEIINNKRDRKRERERKKEKRIFI